MTQSSISPDRILSKSSDSAAHSSWHSPVQGGIATSVEHMLFVETPESFFFFFLPVSRPHVCSSHQCVADQIHMRASITQQYIKLPLCILFSSRDTFLSHWLNLYMRIIITRVACASVEHTLSHVIFESVFQRMLLCGFKVLRQKFLEKCWFVWEDLPQRDYREML